MYFVIRLFVLSSAIILIQCGVSVHNPFYCYYEDPIKPQIGMFAMYTPYEVVRGQINPNVSTCNPSRFWMLGRFATRLPDAPELRNIFELHEQLQTEILSNYDQGRTSLCATDVELLKNWNFDPEITLERALNLASAGWREMEAQAQRYQAAFPSLLPSTYSPNYYFFRSTGTNRTIESLRAFSDGLFGVNGYEHVEFDDIPELDYVLRPYYHCPLYQQVTAVLLERDKFNEGPEYEEMTDQVSAKLGFHGSHGLGHIEIELFTALCRYEQTWNLNSTSPFCSAFSVANHQVLEYYQDLDFYYRTGYGFPKYRRLFENLSCFLMQDLLRFLQSNDVNDQKARIFNTHIPTLNSLFVTLGAFEDDIPLTRHNFAQQTSRLWRTSQLSPMAANLAVIRYDCADGDNDLLFLLNEKPFQIAGCEQNGLCKQSLILKRFSRFLHADCEEVFCRNSQI